MITEITARITDPATAVTAEDVLDVRTLDTTTLICITQGREGDPPHVASMRLSPSAVRALIAVLQASLAAPDLDE